MLTPIKIADGLTDERGRVLLQDPPLVPLLFSHAAAAWLWLGVRLWLGYQWLTAASHKLADPAWTDGSGSAIRSYWTTALGTTPSGKPRPSSAIGEPERVKISGCGTAAEA